MIGQKLRNIFVAKYLPLLKRMEGLEVREKSFEETRATEGGKSYTMKDYEFEIELPTGFEYDVMFRDIIWADGEVKSWFYVTTFSWWEVPQKMESKDWRKFYGRLNLLITRILVEMVSQHFRDARSYRDKIILPNGTIISFKFNLSKLHIAYRTESDNLTDVPVDIPKEGDIIMELVKALSFFLI